MGFNIKSKFTNIMKALLIKNLKKTYSSGQVALKGINLEVEQGDFFALLGNDYHWHYDFFGQ